MKYQGSKERYWRPILNHVLQYRQEGQYYVEPFVGGANVIAHVTGLRIGADSNKYLIAMWQALQNGWSPPVSMTEAQYRDIQQNKDDYPSELVGYVGFNFSYAGKFFGGYARGTGRDYCVEAYENVEAQLPLVTGVTFLCSDYLYLDVPLNSIIYCDPPYAGTTKYKDDFDHQTFWIWCRQMKKAGHQVFVSEYKAPYDWTCLWSKNVTSSLAQDTGSKTNCERLFTLR